MRVLLDHCVPRPLAAMLVGHDVRTTADLGWQDETNGRLLALAAGEFDLFLTVDKSLSRQQNLADLPMPVIVLLSRSNSIIALARHVPGLLSLLNQSLQSRVYLLDEPQDPSDRK